MILSQLVNYVAASFSCNPPTRFSPAWFPAEEQVIAAAISSQVSAIGSALGFLFLALFVKEPNLFIIVFYVILVTQVILTLLVVLYFPDRP